MTPVLLPWIWWKTTGTKARGRCITNSVRGNPGTAGICSFCFPTAIPDFTNKKAGNLRFRLTFLYISNHSASAACRMLPWTWSCFPSESWYPFCLYLLFVFFYMIALKSDVAVQGAQMADAFHTLDQILHGSLLHSHIPPVNGFRCCCPAHAGSRFLP